MKGKFLRWNLPKCPAIPFNKKKKLSHAKEDFFPPDLTLIYWVKEFFTFCKIFIRTIAPSKLKIDLHLFHVLDNRLRRHFTWKKKRKRKNEWKNKFEFIINDLWLNTLAVSNHLLRRGFMGRRRRRKKRSKFIPTFKYSIVNLFKRLIKKQKKVNKLRQDRIYFAHLGNFFFPQVKG